MNRGARPSQPSLQGSNNTNTSAGSSPAQHHNRGLKEKGKWTKLAYAGFLVSVGVLLLSVLFSVIFASNSSKAREAQLVDRNKLQAVFLEGGQVYFGTINELNGKYMRLSNIYYLRVNQPVQPGEENKANDVSLVKLGCELHGPQDQMVINREQVTFWENLKEDGQVTQAVKEYVKANPDGQKCEQQNQQSSNNSTNNPTSNTGGNNSDTPANSPSNSTR